MSKKRIPKYRKQKRRGTADQAIVELDGRRVYLGRFGSSESWEKYHRTIAEWLASGTCLPTAASRLTVTELLAAFWKHVKVYYRGPGGHETSEVWGYRLALKPLRELYGSTAAAEFGPQALKAVRQRMIESGWCRETINHNVIRVKKVFRWAAAEQLLPPTVHAGLACVPHLSKHRSDAREAAPKGVLKPELIRAVEPYVTPQVWALIQLQLHCCARAGELLKLRVADLDMSDEVWSANLREHKNAHRGHRRMIFFGVPGQVILRPFLENRSHDAYLFCPRDAVRYRHRDASHHRRSGQQPTPRRTERVIKEHYTTASYRRAVYRACVKAFPIPDSIQLISDSDVRARRAAEWRRQHYWSPHDLRHFAATRVRDRYNVDVSQVLLGHKRTEATQIYAEVNYAKAREVMLSSESIW